MSGGTGTMGFVSHRVPSVIHRQVDAPNDFAAALRAELAAGALSEAETIHAASCSSALQAAADVLTARGFCIYASEGGADIDDRGMRGTGWHALLATPGEGAAGGAVGVSTYAIVKPSPHAWDEPDVPSDPLVARRASMTRVLTRAVDDTMRPTHEMLEQAAEGRDPFVAVQLSVLVPAWWADRLAEGHTPATATFMLNLLLPEVFARQVQFTDTGLPTMRGFHLIPSPLRQASMMTAPDG